MLTRSFFLGVLCSAAVIATLPALATPVVFQEITEIARQFEQPLIFCKTTPTMGRLPASEIIGKEFPTYVSDGKGGAVLETTNTVTDDVVIARMAKPVSGEIYNEWLIKKNFWKNTYGELPTGTTIKPYYRVRPITAIKVTDKVLKLLASKDGKTATIMIPWSNDGMVVHKDGYLAEFEYGIAPEEMRDNYSMVKPTVTRCSQPLR